MTCDFQSIKDPLDETVSKRFSCCVGNEAVLKALFKLKVDELTLVKAYQVAQEINEAARVAMEIVDGTSKPVPKVEQPKSKANPLRASKPTAKDMPQWKLNQPFSNGSCGRCGKKNHASKDCLNIKDVFH